MRDDRCPFFLPLLHSFSESAKTIRILLFLFANAIRNAIAFTLRTYAIRSSSRIYCRGLFPLLVFKSHVLPPATRVVGCFYTSSLAYSLTPMRRDIHSFPPLTVRVSSHVKITTCPNCRRKSVRVVKPRISIACVFSYTSLLRVCLPRAFARTGVA